MSDKEQCDKNGALGEAALELKGMLFNLLNDFEKRTVFPKIDYLVGLGCLPSSTGHKRGAPVAWVRSSSSGGISVYEGDEVPTDGGRTVADDGTGGPWIPIYARSATGTCPFCKKPDPNFRYDPQGAWPGATSDGSALKRDGDK